MTARARKTALHSFQLPTTFLSERMIYRNLLLLFLECEIGRLRVPLPHGAQCRTNLFESAGGKLSPTRNCRTRGSIANSLAAISVMSGSGNDFARCSARCRQVPEILSPSCARTGPTRKRRIGTGCPRIAFRKGARRVASESGMPVREPNHAGTRRRGRPCAAAGGRTATAIGPGRNGA